MICRTPLALALALCSFQSVQAQNFTVSTKPILTIGDVDGDSAYQLNGVQHVRRLSDRRILVAMGPQLRFFDNTGKIAGSAGGRGRGPGEFQHIQDLRVLPGDTLLVLHFRDKVWLTPQGKYVRQEALDLEPLGSGGWFSEGGVLLPGGNLLTPQYPREVPGDPKRKELHRPVLRYALYDVANKKVQPLIEAGGPRQMVIGERISAVQPFSPQAQHAIGSDRIYVGDNDTTFLAVYSLNGRRMGTIRVADRPTPVTGKDLAEYKRSMLARAGDDARRKAELEQLLAALPAPKRHPYWSSALVDATGSLWVAAPASGLGSRTWTVFDRGGRRTAAVKLPARFQPKEIGTDYVLGVTRDELDVEYVQMFGLSRGARQNRSLLRSTSGNRGN